MQRFLILLIAQLARVSLCVCLTVSNGGQVVKCNGVTWGELHLVGVGVSVLNHAVVLLLVAGGRCRDEGVDDTDHILVLGVLEERLNLLTGVAPMMSRGGAIAGRLVVGERQDPIVWKVERVVVTELAVALMHTVTDVGREV